MELIEYDPHAKEWAQRVRLAAVVERLRGRELKALRHARRTAPEAAALDALQSAIERQTSLEERLSAADRRVAALERTNLDSQHALEAEREANAVLRQQLTAMAELLRKCEAELEATMDELRSMNAELMRARSRRWGRLGRTALRRIT